MSNAYSDVRRGALLVRQGALLLTAFAGTHGAHHHQAPSAPTVKGRSVATFAELKSTRRDALTTLFITTSLIDSEGGCRDHPVHSQRLYVSYL